MKKLLFLLAFPCFAQINYDVVKQTALSGAAEKITVQTPSTSPRLIKFVSAYADCSVACNLTLSLNGTNATTTSLTVNKLDSTTSAATAVAFSSSDVGTGTTIGTYSLPAGGWISLDLSGIIFPPNTTGKNLTLSTDTISGTVNIIIKFQEVIQ